MGPVSVRARCGAVPYLADLKADAGAERSQRTVAASRPRAGRSAHRWRPAGTSTTVGRLLGAAVGADAGIDGVVGAMESIGGVGKSWLIVGTGELRRRRRRRGTERCVGGGQVPKRRALTT